MLCCAAPVLCGAVRCGASFPLSSVCLPAHSCWLTPDSLDCAARTVVHPGTFAVAVVEQVTAVDFSCVYEYASMSFAPPDLARPIPGASLAVSLANGMRQGPPSSLSLLCTTNLLCQAKRKSPVYPLTLTCCSRSGFLHPTLPEDLAGLPGMERAGEPCLALAGILVGQNAPGSSGDHGSN